MVDRQTLLFSTQIFVSCSTLSFSMFMLYIGKDPGIYLPIVTAVLGSWMPSPIGKSTSSAPALIDADLHDVEQPLLGHLSIGLRT